MFRPAVTRALILAFLRDTSCKAVPLDGIGALVVEVRRGSERLLFEITDDGYPTVAGAVPVANFTQAQERLMERGWRAGLLD